MKLAAKVGVIEIDNDEVRLVVVKTGGSLPAIVEAHAGRAAAHATPTERRDALAHAVKDLVSRVKAKPSVYVLCLESQSALVRSITIPFKGRARVAASVAFELEPYLAVPLDDLVIDHCVVREGAAETEVLAVGMRRTQIEEMVNILTAAGVQAEGMGLDAAGMNALWQCRQKNTTGLHALLHVRESGSILTVAFNKGLAYVRPLPLTAVPIQDDPAAAAREVRNSLRAFQATWKGAESVSDLTVTGVKLTPEERETFEANLSLTVFYQDLLQGIKGAGLLDTAVLPPRQREDGEDTPYRGHRSNRWEAAIGVALGATGATPSFDFRAGLSAQKQSWRVYSAHLVFSAALVLLAVVGASGYALIDYRRNTAEVNKIGQEIWDVYAATFPNAPLVAEGRPASDPGGIKVLEVMQAEHDKVLEEGSDVPVDLLMRPPLLDVLRELGEKLPTDKVQITDMKIRDTQGPNQSITISGEFTDATALNEAFAQLKATSQIMTFEEDLVRSTKDGKNTFVIVASL